MTSIIGYADTLYQKKLSEDEVHSAARVILNEGMRLEALSFKLLELITLDKNDFRLEETRISEIIADCVETAHEAAKSIIQRLCTVRMRHGCGWNMICLRPCFLI